tara:strand:- start:508 stop:1140 length:633 start_codon:yes stop_codon:yes gene_type:complete
MEYNVVTAFPSPIIQVYVEEDTSELLGHDQYTASFETRERFDHRDALASQRVLEKYPKTKQILLNKYISVAEDILKYRKRNYAITTSWFTLSKKGEGSQSHKHKNSFWSCVYYYQEEYSEGTGGILFNSPNTDLFDYAFFENDIEEQNHLNSRACVILPQPNLLLVFPSYLQHQIMKHNNDTPRSSLAFNIVPLGSWGNGDSHYDMNWVQ